jgi:hypothetical protein
MNLNPISGIIESVGKVAGDLITTDKERMQLELEGRKLDQAVDLAQIGVNNTEAASTNWFVAGGRPFILWVCGVSLAYASLIEPIARFVAKVAFGYTGEFPVIDTDLTMQVLFGLLGLGGLRTFEKLKGVAR